MPAASQKPQRSLRPLRTFLQHLFEAYYDAYELKQRAARVLLFPKAVDPFYYNAALQHQYVHGGHCGDHTYIENHLEGHFLKVSAKPA